MTLKFFWTTNGGTRMATKIKMIVTDMDGTFLNDAHGYDHQLFSKTYTRMVTAKIPLVIASGSSYHRLTREFANQVDQLTFISQNGAVVHRGHQLLSVSPLTNALLTHVLALITDHFAAGQLAQLVVSGVNASYIDQSMSAANRAIVKTFYEKVIAVSNLRQVATLVDDQLTFSPTVDWQAATAWLTAHLPAGLALENSGFHTSQIGLASATKQGALLTLTDQERVEAEHVVTFGDNENDLGLLTMTPQSYAMKNAAPFIQGQAANVTAHTNNESGVLRTINALLDQRIK